MADEIVTTVVPKTMEIVKPQAWSLTSDDQKKIAIQFCMFTAVPALAFLYAIRDGKSVQEAFSLALIPALINSLINVIIKFQSSTPYLREK